MQFRRYDPKGDRATLEAWWKGHNAVAVPEQMLPPDGWIAHADGVEMAASFLYVVKGNIAILEFTTTNPRCALSRDLVAAVRGLYERLEVAAREEGCCSIISFVKPDSWERREMVKSGYAVADENPHMIIGKPLAPKEEALCH
jgi:hypothetical protein